MTKLFGTDGIRGHASQFPLDATTIRVIGASLTSHLRKQLDKPEPLLVIGRDTRESGPWIERAFIEGATEAGAVCKSAGVITTPGVAFLARSLPADAGVVISASHNPYQDNGIKIFSPSGRKLEDTTERLIEADIHTAGSNDQAVDSHSSLQADSDEAVILQQRYLDFLEKEIGAGLSLNNLTLVIDCANGASSKLAPELFTRLGAKVIAINNEPDGRNINYNCGSLHMDGLIQRVLAESADLGIAFDGDADRALFVDSNGTFVDGDATLWALAKYLDDKGKLKLKTVVATVMSNLGLELALQARGLRLVRKDVGDKYVLEELLRSGASLGGEQSGHLIFPELSLAGDGMITTLSLLRAMAESGNLSLAEMTDGFNRYPQILVNVRVSEKVPFEELPAVKSLEDEVKSDLGERGRLLLRYSGTERLARVMIEGEQQNVIEDYANQIADAIRSSIGAKP